MGRLFLVEFDQTPEVRFYCCRTCQAHIVLSQHCISRFEQLGEGRFSNVVNVVADEPEHRWMNGTSPVEDIYCVRCNKPLGWRYIPATPDGIAQLKLAHLLFWNGTRLLNADTLLDPMVDQENHDQEDQEDHDQENQEDQADHDQEDQGFQDEEDEGDEEDEDEDDQGPDDNMGID